jgi:catechol 2,3-dioxygenase-like lactoylglutathione lyase family enzyme
MSLPIESIHHLSYVTRQLAASRAFYRDVLGFREIERPNLGFEGAWLYNYGVQIHLIVNASAPEPTGEINSRADHVAFFSRDVDQVEQTLIEAGVPFRVNRQSDTGLKQLFFRDPDGHHLEVADYSSRPLHYPAP